jgi:hypothetical protein
VIDIHLQHLRELQQDAIRLQAKSVARTGQPEGDTIGVVLKHLEQAIHKMEGFLAVQRPQFPPELSPRTAH